jgi:hypothetical protein
MELGRDPKNVENNAFATCRVVVVVVLRNKCVHLREKKWPLLFLNNPILETHHNLSSFSAHFIRLRGRILPSSSDRKLVNNDDVPHCKEDDIFDPRSI